MQRVTRFNGALMADDMAANGWNAREFATRVKPRVAVSTITRFLNGEHQTPPMAKRLAKALGYDVRRYLNPSSERQAAGAA